MSMAEDALLASTDVEEAFSEAYVYAIAAAARFVVAKGNFDRDGVDVTISAGGDLRPKIDVQLKATINLTQGDEGFFRYKCPRRNYDLLRVATQTPRILVVLDLPKSEEEWMSITTEELILRRSAYWTCLAGSAETDNATSITIDLPQKNRFDVDGLRSLMEQSRTGRITP